MLLLLPLLSPFSQPSPSFHPLPPLSLHSSI
jgi:hypothetical protein